MTHIILARDFFALCAPAGRTALILPGKCAPCGEAYSHVRLPLPLAFGCNQIQNGREHYRIAMHRHSFYSISFYLIYTILQVRDPSRSI